MGFKASETLLGIETSRKNHKDLVLVWFKASETLLGIETWLLNGDNSYPKLIQSLWNPFRDWNEINPSAIANTFVRFKASETLLGIETWLTTSLFIFSVWFKASETLLGIETLMSGVYQRRYRGFKASETLLGIETTTGKSSW